MLSYRHAFHAGNHADILKHYTFSLILDYFNQKDKPYHVIDTHAGAGIYAIQSDFSQKNMEFETGVSRLLKATQLPESLVRFVTMIQSFNPTPAFDFYPGSPKVAEYFLRDNDKLRLFELHPNEYKILLNNFNDNKKKQTQIVLQDGFQGLKACLPPPTKRGIMIIDPPYEQKQDYQQVVSTIQDSLKRFASGSYIIWYPLLAREEPQEMVNALRGLDTPNWLNLTLQITNASEDIGMYGSGLYIINPPWTLPKTLQESLPILTKLLAKDEHASHQLTYEIA